MTAVEDCVVDVLVVVLPKLLLAGVKVVGVVNVPPFTILIFPVNEDSNDEPPILPLI